LPNQTNIKNLVINQNPPETTIWQVKWASSLAVHTDQQHDDHPAEKNMSGKTSICVVMLGCLSNHKFQ